MSIRHKAILAALLPATLAGCATGDGGLSDVFSGMHDVSHVFAYATEKRPATCQYKILDETAEMPTVANDAPPPGGYVQTALDSADSRILLRAYCDPKLDEKGMIRFRLELQAKRYADAPGGIEHLGGPFEEEDPASQAFWDTMCSSRFTLPRQLPAARELGVRRTRFLMGMSAQYGVGARCSIWPVRAEGPGCGSDHRCRYRVLVRVATIRGFRASPNNAWVEVRFQEPHFLASGKEAGR